MTSVSNALTERSRTQIAIWLLVVCALIYAMVVLGGVTRLTRSGLSMVEWDPIMGVVPPLTDSQWQETYRKYQQFPEYRELNRGMSLHEFKSIFWMEYAHRLLGRAIGIVFLLPLLYFLLRRRIRGSLIPKTVTMFVLGGLQGLLGWYMVKSGLVDRPHVSQYRLTAHLLAAFAIYAYIGWVALGLLWPRANNTAVTGVAGLRRFGYLVTALVVLMVTTGGLVAGTKAGFAFNTFPLMNGSLLPDGMFGLQPLWTNFFDNLATVQFNHRWLAMITAAVVIAFWFRSRRQLLHPRTRLVAHLLLAAGVVQITLGLLTLLLVVPVPLAAAHQAGALALFSVALVMNFELRRRDTAPV